MSDLSEDWRGVMATNLDGVFLSCREGARRFVEQGTGGSMILVSSRVSRFGAAQQAAYAASKTGVLGPARTLAVELARHRVRVNTLVPGWTRTGLTVPRQEAIVVDGGYSVFSSELH